MSQKLTIHCLKQPAHQKRKLLKDITHRVEISVIQDQGIAAAVFCGVDSVAVLSDAFHRAHQWEKMAVDTVSANAALNQQNAALIRKLKSYRALFLSLSMAERQHAMGQWPEELANELRGDWPLEMHEALGFGKPVMGECNMQPTTMRPVFGFAPQKE